MATAHSFNRRIICWMYCSRCGLIRLNNEATRQAVRQGCS